MVRTYSPIKTRFLTKSDFPDILRIEIESFSEPISEGEYRQFLLTHENAGTVAEIDGKVVGYMFFSYKIGYILLHSIAVEKKYRRKTIATQLVDKLKMKLEPATFRSIRCDVWEKNLAMQLLLKSCGFFCTEIVPGSFKPPHDKDQAYMLQYFL